MESIIALLVFALIVLLVLPAVVSLSSNARIKELKKEVDILKKYIVDLHKSVENIKNQNVVRTEQKEEKVSPTPVPKPIHPTREEVPKPITPLPESPKESLKPLYEQPLKEEKPDAKIPQTLPENKEEQKEPINKTIPLVTVPPVVSVKKKTNFEQFIGEKLMSLVGIGILVLGIFFTIKWAIDRHLITDAGKILIGLGAATVLIAVAHKLSKNYRAFSSILAGGGIAVLYFSIYQAYQAYHLLPQTAAFAAMVMITLLAVTLSLVYDKKELAIIAMLGGFATPFFVSNGAGNYQILFSYLLLLNIGMFFVSVFKRWNLLNIIGYILTVLIFGLWANNEVNHATLNHQAALLFASLFYLVFFATNIIYNIRQKQKFAAIEISLLLSNSFLYLGAGLYFLLHIQGGDFRGMFVIGLAVFNFAFAYIFFKNQQIDKNLVYLLIGLVLTFISLAGPVQLHGNYITLFWAAEAVILYWLSVKSKIQVIKNASPIVVLLCMISLFIDWNHNYFAPQINKLPLILNKAFITGMAVITALLVNLRWVRRDEETHIWWGILPVKVYEYILGILTVVMLYAAFFLEIHYQSFTITRMPECRDILLWAYHFIFIKILLWYTMRYRNFTEQRAIAFVAALSLLAYPVANMRIIDFRTISLFHTEVSALFYFHYLIPLAAVGVIFLLIRFVTRNFKTETAVFKAAGWYLTFATVFVLSSEVVHIWVVSAYQPGFQWSESVRKAMRVAWPILWALVSLALMWMGMRKRIKHLRIISLALFSLTILKLFIYDIARNSQGGRIAAFIILGVILLIVSFMYQKIKNLFTDEKVEDDNTDHPNV